MNEIKKAWMNNYRRATPELRKATRDYWIDIWKGAIFPETLKLAEERLAWAAIIDNE